MWKKTSRNERSALICATDLLLRQDHSESRLRQKLIGKKYPEDEVSDAIAKLKKYNYLNDQRACEYQFELMYSSNKYSVKQICFKLVNLGFDKDLVDSFKPEDYNEHDKIVAERLLRAKFKAIPEDKKMWNFLSAKGFDYSDISFAVNKFKNDDSDE